MSRIKPLEWFLLALLLAGAGWLVYSNYATFRDWQRQSILNNQGVTTSAQVLDAQRSIHGRNSSYSVKYTFQAGGQARTVTEPVDITTYQNADVLKTVDVRYLPDQPQVSQIKGNAATRVNILSIVLLDLLALGALLFILWGFRR